MDDLYLRIRIDGAIAARATEMAREHLEMELPDAIRMWLARAVQTGSFSLNPPRQDAQGPDQTRAFYAYNGAQWDPLKRVLDGELALALLNQQLASRTVEIEALLESPEHDTSQVAELRRQRDEARERLRGFDPNDREAVQAALGPLGLHPAPDSPNPPTGAEGRGKR